MLSWGDDVEARGLRRRGWSISAIAWHLGHDRKAARAYLRGEREPGRWASQGAVVMAPFVGYCRIRLAERIRLTAWLKPTRSVSAASRWPSRSC